MRHALVSLIAALSVAAPALAQEATPAVPAVPTETPAAPATVAVPVADPSTPAIPAVQTPPPAPAAPTDPAAIQLLSVLENVCKPLVQGGDLVALAKPLGFKKKRDVQTLTFGKPGVITVAPPGSNKNTCLIEIEHAVHGDQALTVAIHDYAIARGYTLYRNDEFTTDLKRHTRSWEITADGKTEALVLVTTRKPDGSSMARNADRSTLMYSVQAQ